MGAVVHGGKLIGGQMGVLLRCIQRRMAEHFLDGPQVGSFIEQMRGVRMSQGVRAHAPAGKPAGVSGDNPGDASGA
jgi:hypothetical protein